MPPGVRPPDRRPHGQFHGRCTRNSIPLPSRSSDNVEDNEDKNLSWLFNFKLDDIANLSPEIKRKRSNNNSNSNQHHQQQQQQQSQQHVENHQQQNFYNQVQQVHYDDGTLQRSAKDPCIEDDLNVAENIVISNVTSYSTHT
jgi:hypothetical protein